MTVNGIDKVLGDDARRHLQTGDVGVEAAAHLRTVEATGCPQLTGDEASVLGQRQQDGVLNAPLLGLGMTAAAVVAEIRPPLTTDEACLAGKELAIDVAALSNDGALPLPQRPVPPAIGQQDVAAVVVNHLLGREAGNTAVKQRQEACLCYELYELSAVVDPLCHQSLLFSRQR